MTVTNYYLVHKDTKKVHFLFKIDPHFLSKDGRPEAWLSGRLYRSDPAWAFTLEQLYALDYSEDYWIPNLECTSDALFEFFAQIDYASYKGYKLYDFARLQRYDDFGGNDIIEMNAFLAALFMQYIGQDEVKRWNEPDGSFIDQYGVNELVMRNFTIETDSHEGIFYHNSLTDDYDWKGFPIR